jgi:hypothetical protein
MSDAASGRRQDTGLTVGEPHGRMAVERPACRVGNGQGDNPRMAGKHPVIDGVKGSDAVVVASLRRGRLDREQVE